MFTTQSFNQPHKPTLDLSLIQDYEIRSKSDWINWQQCINQQLNYIPLGFNNRFNFYKNIKYCDLTQYQDDPQFVTVEESVKKKNKEFISKNNKMAQNRQSGNTNRRIYTKKMQKNQRTWTNQIKTNFKKVTVKKNWHQIKTINKNTLQSLPEIKKLQVTNIKTIGSLRFLNNQVDQIKWQQIKFKQNATYTVEPLKTADDIQLSKIAVKLMQQQQQTRVSIICNPTFLLAILTLKAGVYPWNIQIQKDGNIIVLQNFKSPDDQNDKLSYLDLYTINENTINNMPSQQSKIKQNCIAATKMSKVFHDLLASGDQVSSQLIQSQFQDNQEQQQQQQEEQQQAKKSQQKMQKLRKYLKISFDNIDIYTYFQIDGVKQNPQTKQLSYYLIRTFMENQTQGAWIKDMKTPGAMITKQYQSNTCSIQKWICSAKLIGIQNIKVGYIGFGQNKTPVLLNVDTISAKNMESTLSFKYEACWSNVKYIFGLLAQLDSSTYVLSKNPYSPLLMKLYKTANVEEQDGELNEPQRKNTDEKEENK